MTWVCNYSLNGMTISFIDKIRLGFRNEPSTSCKIKAKENTSTLVSYSSFLETSGAMYRPVNGNQQMIVSHSQSTTSNDGM